MRRLRGLIHDAGLRIVVEQTHTIGSVRRLPKPVGKWMAESRLTQDLIFNNVEYVLQRA